MAIRKEEKTEFYEKTQIEFEKNPFLVVIQGKELGKVYSIKDGAIIGRSADCDIRLYHSSISRQHARIYFDKKYFIEDIGSTNGIYIENKKIVKKSAIQSGDIIRIGNHIVKFSLSTDPELVYHEEIYDMATRDALTHLYNRRYFIDTGSMDIDRCIRNRESVCLGMFDIDKFKSVNDEFGHSFGDLVIRGVANNMVKCIRTSDLAARTGGEEFSILFFGASLEQAQVLCTKIKELQASTTYKFKKKEVRVSVSAGVAMLPQTYTGDNPLSFLFESADTALYEAKHAGRNKVICFSMNDYGVTNL